MIHLSLLLLHLQFCCLFISIIISFHSLYIHYLIIFISFHSFSSPASSSVVNVVLVFNDSLIILAPDSPISLAVHINYHFISLFVYTLSYYIHFISFNFSHHSDSVQSMLYLFSMIRLPSLLLVLQSFSLNINPL